MPLIQANGLRLYYRIDGRDDSPSLILAHSLGCDHSQWDVQAAQLQPHFRWHATRWRSRMRWALRSSRFAASRWAA